MWKLITEFFSTERPLQSEKTAKLITQDEDKFFNAVKKLRQGDKVAQEDGFEIKLVKDFSMKGSAK
jgi:hypothetical protein